MYIYIYSHTYIHMYLRIEGERIHEIYISMYIIHVYVYNI